MPNDSTNQKKIWVFEIPGRVKYGVRYTVNWQDYNSHIPEDNNILSFLRKILFFPQRIIRMVTKYLS